MNRTSESKIVGYNVVLEHWKNSRWRKKQKGKENNKRVEKIYPSSYTSCSKKGEKTELASPLDNGRQHSRMLAVHNCLYLSAFFIFFGFYFFFLTPFFIFLFWSRQPSSQSNLFFPSLSISRFKFARQRSNGGVIFKTCKKERRKKLSAGQQPVT